MDPLALIFASANGDLTAVRSLLQAGADVHARHPPGQATALLAAAVYGHTAVARELLRAGARVEDKTIHGQTALYKASLGGHVDVVRVLLAAGASAHTRDETQRTPLYAAASKGHAAVVRVLVHEGGARVDDTDVSGFRALQIACLEGHVEAARALVAARADVHARTKQQLTPLHSVAMAGQVAVIRLLVHHAGARLEDKDWEGKTANGVVASTPR